MERPKNERITELTLADGTVVTDPAEINRLLRVNGFTVDDATGNVGVSPELQSKVRQS